MQRDVKRNVRTRRLPRGMSIRIIYKYIIDTVSASGTEVVYYFYRTR